MSRSGDFVVTGRQTDKTNYLWAGNVFLVLFTSSACVWGYISVIFMEGVVICEKGIHLIWGWSFRGLQSNTGLLSNVGVSIILLLLQFSETQGTCTGAWFVMCCADFYRDLCWKFQQFIQVLLFNILM